MVVSLYDWDPPGLQADDYLGRYKNIDDWDFSFLHFCLVVIGLLYS